LLELLQLITGIFVVVYDGQHALRYTLGRAGDVVGPGIHFKWPIIQKYRVQDTRHTTLDLDPQVIQLRDELVYEVDCKLIYQIVDVRRALIEVDNLVQGLKNRVAIAVQQVVKLHDRSTVRDVATLVSQVQAELGPIEEQWGIRIVEFGFSNLSPSRATLEITQLRLLSEEKLRLYHELMATEGMLPEAAVALISGAVVTVPASADGAR
jgi:regulator of protease activity HflC (stomatin/prohibitin superfamily)